MAPSKSLVRLTSVYEIAAPMPDTESNFLMFRETLAELECLIDVRLKGELFNLYSSNSRGATAAIEDGIVYMLELLTEYDINTSEANAVEELERLVEMENARDDFGQVCIDHERGRSILEKMIDSKVNFIKNSSFSRLDSKDGVESMAALKRLAAVNLKASSRCMDSLLEAKIREIVWRPRVKASPRHVHIVRRRC